MEAELIFRKAHAIAGYTIFGIAILQFALKKSGDFHKNLGKIYLLAWLAIVFTGAMIGHVLITFLGVLGAYFAFTGATFARLKSNTFDTRGKAIVLIGCLSAVSLLMLSVIALINKNYYMVIVGLFFSVIFGTNAAIDLKQYILGKPHKKMFSHKANWYFEHFTRMIVSFIAAMTAFSVIQGVFGSGSILNWLLPTFIGTAAIIITQKRYRKKMNIKL